MIEQNSGTIPDATPYAPEVGVFTLLVPSIQPEGTGLLTPVIGLDTYQADWEKDGGTLDEPTRSVSKQLDLVSTKEDAVWPFAALLLDKLGQDMKAMEELAKSWPESQTDDLQAAEERWNQGQVAATLRKFPDHEALAYHLTGLKLLSGMLSDISEMVQYHLRADRNVVVGFTQQGPANGEQNG